jgi:hypothetical protein
MTTGNLDYLTFAREQQATIHFCSRSIIIEIEGDSGQPLYKYLFKYFATEPDFGEEIQRLICYL